MAKPSTLYEVSCRLVCIDDCGTIIGDSVQWSGRTRAVSKKQAINNVRFRHGGESPRTSYSNGRELWVYEYDVHEVA